MTKITLDRLREVLVYDANTGVFRWRVTRGSTARAGQVAGTRTAGGHLKVGIDRNDYTLHRLAWLYVYGEWPAGVVDHINGIGSDNRIINLRDVPQRVNCENQRAAKTSSLTGALGVSPVAGSCSWRARIQVNGKAQHLGCFPTKEAAHAAYVLAKRQLHEGNTL